MPARHLNALRQKLTPHSRSYPHQNCLLKCLPNCLSPIRDGFASSKLPRSEGTVRQLPHALWVPLQKQMCGNVFRKSRITARDSRMNSTQFTLQIQTLGSKRIHSVIISATTVHLTVQSWTCSIPSATWMKKAQSLTLNHGLWRPWKLTVTARGPEQEDAKQENFVLSIHWTSLENKRWRHYICNELHHNKFTRGKPILGACRGVIGH